MKAGIGKVGQRVQLTRKYPAYPEVEAGTMGTIQEIITQIPGAPEDAFLWHPDSWKHDDMVMPCYSADMEPEAEAPPQIWPLWTHECPECKADVTSDCGEGEFECPKCLTVFTVEIPETQ